MCNPRRIQVRATRELSEAWEQEVQRRITLRGQAVGEARVREPLDTRLGAPTLAALAGVLQQAEGWEWRDDAFHHPLDGGDLIYHPDTQELEIVARAIEDIEVSAEAATIVRGEVSDTIEEVGTGTYYTDGYRGTTRRTAREAAARAAQRALALRARTMLNEARRAAEAREGVAVAATAAANAEAELSRRAADRAADLREAAGERMIRVGVQGRNVFHQVLLSAYRDAISAYARARGAAEFRSTEHGGVLDIEFELEV